MSGPFGSSQWMYKTGGFYPHEIDQSLKFNDADNPYLYRTPASQGNLTTFTFSFWYKRCVFGTYQEVLHEYPGSGERSQILFMNDDTLKVELEAANVNHFRTNRLFRDPSAWYNIVVAYNSGDSTSTNRVKIYVNGVDESDTANGGSGFSTANYPSQSATSGFNTTSQHEISTYDASDYHLDGYLAEVNFIDGTALTAASFGETKDGIWVPIDTSGLTFGTNGFHLTFKDDVISEGFNTAIFEGNSTTQSISGLGFSPGLVWVKDRDNGNSNAWSDVVRGRGRNLISNATNAEVSAAAATDKDLISFDADGFSVGQFEDGTYNNNGSSMVAWCWEAGGAPTADNSAGTSAVPTSNSAKVDGSNHGSALSGSIAFTRASANTTKGFSVITYTGNGSAGATVDHLLGDTPDWFIVKRRDSSASWQVFHTSLGATKFIDLHYNGAADTNTNRWNDTAPTSSVVSLGTNSNVNSNGGTYVLYCWAGKSGYSAFGSFTGNGGSQAIDVGFAPAWVMLRRTNGGTWGIFDNTRQSQNSQMLGANSSAAETTNSTFTFSGNTFNDNGYLSDNGATVLYMAFADTREAAFFKDVSGQGNHWTPVNLDYRDSVPDVPTNNFATFNPLNLPADAVLSEGSTRVTQTSNDRAAIGNMAMSSGKWYYEVYYPASSNPEAGLARIVDSFANSGATGSSDKFLYITNSGGFRTPAWTSTDATGVGAQTSETVLGFAIDADNGKAYISVNGTYLNSGNPATGSNPQATFDADWVTQTGGGVVPFIGIYTGTGSEVRINFGQDSSFSGAKSTANSNADENGFGSFQYAPPSGFLALCSRNLSQSAIVDGSENFNTILYTADGNASRAITGVGFQPDWLWVKSRNATYYHGLWDSVRTNKSALYSNATDVEDTSTAGTLGSLDADGFTTPNVSGGGFINIGSTTYVAWNWKAGTAFSNDASATSVGTIDSTGSINTKAGFSIISYTGNNTSNATVAHGLSSTPEMIIVRARNEAENWVVYHKDITPASNSLSLNLTIAPTSFGSGWIDNATSTVFRLKDGASDRDNVNKNTTNYIAYCFHSVEGYSKVGSYTGNGNADGPFIYPGFRPAWIMIKNATGTGGWEIHDNKRVGYNPADETLDANTTAAEATGNDLDILSNGFKVRNTYGTSNTSSSNYIYLAFADQPFKYSNAR